MEKSRLVLLYVLEPNIRSFIGHSKFLWKQDIMKIWILSHEFPPTLDEGMLNSLLEAMACGLPVLTTDAGDNTRLVVPQANEEALADGLQRLLKDTEGRSYMAKASRQSALDWTWDTVAKQYIELFELSPI